MIDPTGRTALLTNRKLARLAVLLAGVFVVGCGIGWLVSQLGGSPPDTGSQRAATTLPVPVPPSPAPVQPEEAAPAQPPAADSVPASSAPPSVAPPQATPASAPAPAPPLVVIEQPEPVSPAPAAAPTAVAPQATPAPAAPVHHPHHKHPARTKHGGHHHRHHHGVRRSGTVTVIGAKAAVEGSRWIVQLGAFRTHDHAALLAMTLKADGTPAAVTRSDRGAKGIWYVVQMGGAMPLKSAVATAHRIATREGIAAYVMKTGE